MEKLVWEKSEFWNYKSDSNTPVKDRMYWGGWTGCSSDFARSSGNTTRTVQTASDCRRTSPCILSSCFICEGPSFSRCSTTALTRPPSIEAVCTARIWPSVWSWSSPSSTATVSKDLQNRFSWTRPPFNPTESCWWTHSSRFSFSMEKPSPSGGQRDIRTRQNTQTSNSCWRLQWLMLRRFFCQDSRFQDTLTRNKAAVRPGSFSARWIANFNCQAQSPNIKSKDFKFQLIGWQ